MTTQKKYALLLLPSLNRVYFETSKQIAIAELSVLNLNLHSEIDSIELSDISGVPYITFQGDLSENDISLVSNHSALYSLYEVEGDFLRPVQLNRKDRFNDDLITIQKYSGKTNEHFTKLLLNTTVSSSRYAKDPNLNILDPMCGRGTTMLQAMMYGYNSAGIEITKNLVSSFETFIKSYVKTKRLKHKFQTAKKKQRLLTVYATKQDFKEKKEIRLTITNADTLETSILFPKNDFHCIVVDLPYGVQHGSSSKSTLERSPDALLKKALPAWNTTLKSGGCIGLAWNVNTCPREKLINTLEESGLQVLDSDEYKGFKHRVDQAVVRDIIIATKL